MLRSGLGALRRSAARVRPSWVALLPDSGDVVPGAVPDEPATGVLRTVWVSRDWIPAPELAALEEAVRGAYREEVAGGVLLVTDPRAADGVAGWGEDPRQWWPRVVDAAAVLARVARTSRP